MKIKHENFQGPLLFEENNKHTPWKITWNRKIHPIESECIPTLDWKKASSVILRYNLFYVRKRSIPMDFPIYQSGELEYLEGLSLRALPLIRYLIATTRCNNIPCHPPLVPTPSHHSCPTCSASCARRKVCCNWFKESCWWMTGDWPKVW